MWIINRMASDDWLANWTIDSPCVSFIGVAATLQRSLCIVGASEVRNPFHGSALHLFYIMLKCETM